jgi:hypothetical protein
MEPNDKKDEKKKKKKKKGGFVFCPRHKILKMLLVLLVAAWCCSARLLSLDADITSERGSSRLVVRRKHTVDGVGVEVELASSSSSSSSTSSSLASSHVLVSAVAGCAVTVRQFGRGSNAVATVVAVLAPKQSRVSHAALVAKNGHDLRNMRVGNVLVQVLHAKDGSVIVNVWPDSGKTRWRAAASAKLGRQAVKMHNTARLDKKTGILRAGFAVELLAESKKVERHVDHVDDHRVDEHHVDDHHVDEHHVDEHHVDEHHLDEHHLDEHHADDVEHHKDEHHTVDVDHEHHMDDHPAAHHPSDHPAAHPVDLHDLSEEEKVLEAIAKKKSGSHAPRTSHGIVLTPSEARDMDLVSDSIDDSPRREKKSKKKATTKTKPTTKATSRTTATTVKEIPTPKPDDEVDDELGLVRTKSTIDLIKSVKKKKKKKKKKGK